MLRKLQLAAVIAVAFSVVGIMDSAEGHIRGRGGVGGGIRIGGGLLPRARQPGNANGNRIGGNPPIAGRMTPVPPAPKAVTPPAASPPIVQIGGTTSSKSPAKSATASTTKPTTGNLVSNPPQSKPASVPATSKVTQPEHLVFNLTGNAAPVADRNATESSTVQSKGLSSETRQALADALATDQPAAETAPAEVVSKEVATKEVALPQIPVGATVTLNGNDLSDKEGQVVLQIGEIALPATITAWKNNLVTCTLPVLGLTKTSKATLHVLKADGKTASLLDCELVIPLPTAANTPPSRISPAAFER